MKFGDEDVFGNWDWTYFLKLGLNMHSKSG
jgi:hypothetical protein